MAEALLDRGDEVVGLTRDAAAAKTKQPKVEWHNWDAATEPAPAAALEGVDGVINLVGEKINQRWTDAAKERIRLSRIDATRNLVAGILAADPKPGVLVSGSAVGYYGPRGDDIVDESDGPGNTFDAQVCVDWEAAAAQIEGNGVRLAIIRTGLVLDGDSGLLKELKVPFKLGVGGPVAGGKNYMPWISLEDEVAMILWLLDTPGAEGVYNGTAPEPVTNKEFSKALGKELKRPAFMPVPKFAVKVRLGSEMGEAATKGQRAIPKKAEAEGFSFAHGEIAAGLQSAFS